MIDAIKVLHDYTYLSPERPVPTPGEVVDVTYEASDVSPQVRVRTDARGIATLTVSVPEDQLVEALAAARANLAAGLGHEGEGGEAQARAELGDAEFDQRASTVARTFFLSAAVLRTRLFPLLVPQELTHDTIVPGESPAPGATYVFEVQYPLTPRGELSSYDALELESVPPRAEVTPEMIAARTEASARGEAKKRGVEAIDPESDDYKRIRRTAISQLSQDISSAWTEQVMTTCNHELSKRLTQEPPEYQVAMLRNELANDYAENLVREQGVDWDAYTKSDRFDMDTFKRHMTEEARLTLATSMAVDAMADHVGVLVSRQDILQSVGEGGKDEDHDRSVLTLMMMTGQLPQICQVTRRYKTSDVITRLALRRYEERQAAAQAGEGAGAPAPQAPVSPFAQGQASGASGAAGAGDTAAQGGQA